jgi:hypothetical protein
MKKSTAISLVAYTCILLSPAPGWAQQSSGIAGVVRDASGAVLPGVTVEAASPALIEKTRIVVTDGEGRYNIVDLRPGSYAVSFTLTGFSTLRRENITLTAGFTATVNADMQLGALEETLTVSSSAPTVDTTNVHQQKVIAGDLIGKLPSGSMGIMGFAKFTPGMSGGLDSGGASGIYSGNAAFSATLHGKGGVKFSYDGMQTNNFGLGLGATSYIMNPATVVETTVQTGGISPESNASGVSINMIPKEGGNALNFELSGTFANHHLQSENLDDTLRDRGLTTTSKVLALYDVNVTAGGPIKKDRLWFFLATRFLGNKNQVPGVYFNETQGTPLYTPDLDRPSYRKEWLRSQGGRLTWQASPKNKVSVFADVQYLQLRGSGASVSPEADTCLAFWPQGLYQASWTSPRTSRFLLEAGASLAKGPWPCTREQSTDIFGFTVNARDVSILETSTGFRYNAKSTYNDRADDERYGQRFAASYVTGSHAFKAGVQLYEGIQNLGYYVNEDVNYSFLRGVPVGITQWASPYTLKNRMKADLGVFAQDQWIIKRLTLNYGVRVDYMSGSVPAQHVDAGQFVGARDFAAVHGVPNWTDLNPRLGAAYDLFGTGRTAIKWSLGRYVGRMGTFVAQVNNPIATSINQVNRTWTDGNSDYVPDCDLRNFSANGECGAISNVNFGRNNPNATQYSPDLISGFGNRDYFWDLGVELQHQLGPNLSVSGGYYRNWSTLFSPTNGFVWDTGVTDNLAVTPEDFSPFCITAPVDPRLPNGGGYQVCGLYDLAPAKFGQGQLLVTTPSNYDDGEWRHSDFFTLGVHTRFGTSGEFSATLDTGRTVTDTCFVVDSPQALLNCHVVAPFKGQTQVKMYGSYPLPGGFVVSGVLQSVSGFPYQANYTARNAEIVPSLGRNLAACGTQVVCNATATVPLIAPWTHFEPRRTLLDLRVSKLFTVGRTMRLRANLDTFNVLNSSSIMLVNNNYGALWRRPQGDIANPAIAVGRLVQLGARLEF